MGRLDAAVASLLENPFKQGPAVWHDAKTVLLASKPSERLESCVGRGRLLEARRLALAWGHVLAVEGAGAPEPLLATGPEPRLLARLPGGRSGYLRVVSAAGRAHAQLTALIGRSRAMAELRRTAWAACFGDGLLDVLELERVIRDHDVLIWARPAPARKPSPRRSARAPWPERTAPPRPSPQ